MSNDNVLKPVNFGMDDSKLAGTDQFGQQFNPDSDKSKLSGESAAESRKNHSRSDVDTGNNAQHHTLGTKANQASPGNHVHDGTTSKKIGPLRLAAAGGTEPEWRIPVAYTLADVVGLMQKFVAFRVSNTP